MGMVEIRFGTDGWRAKMGENFTFANIRLVAQGYANFLKKNHPTGDIRVLVNHDTRYLAAEFAREAVKVLSTNRITVFSPERDSPTPAVSLAIGQNRLHGAMVLTASFHELLYNGVKFFSATGASMLPSQTLLLEREIAAIRERFQFLPCYSDGQYIKTCDLRPPYLAYLAQVVNFDLIRDSAIRIVVDNLYGTSRDYLDKLLIDHGTDVLAIHNYTDAFFGGVLPSSDRASLRELSRLVRERGADIGLATNLDGDRFGVVDARGRFIPANLIMPLLVEYLLGMRQLEGGIVKSVSTTDLIDRVAAHYRRKVYETPVGFKYLADMVASRNALLGIESSNGASLRGPVRVRDGILFNLLIAEMVAHHQKPLTELLADFFRRFPRRISREIPLAVTASRQERYQQLLDGREIPFGDNRPLRINRLDGSKFIFADSWLLIRQSGTRPVIRLYAEASSKRRVDELLQLGRRALG